MRVLLLWSGLNAGVVVEYRRGTFGWDGTFDVGYDRHMYSI